MTETDSPDSLTCPHRASIALPGLQLEIYADPQLETSQADWKHCPDRLEQHIKTLWPHFLSIAKETAVFETLGIDPTRHTLEIDLTWTGNALMQRLNQEYRQKDTATDVLTFTLFADSPDTELWLSLPVVQLGSIFISIDWATKALQENKVTESTNYNGINAEMLPSLDAYLMERFVHGLLHLHGLHHDTMEKYHHVVSIQKKVLAATFSELPFSESLSSEITSE